MRWAKQVSESQTADLACTSKAYWQMWFLQSTRTAQPLSRLPCARHQSHQKMST